ncbi:uncharacterized protein HD556DRAFT_1428452 [Suillus plorans]|uniref:C2H2-type domain-containing protein n=1 Tax=Suillus plorans TaxID=116603 RepID=A0A9P7E4J3_9AGAM|nr:uncharacterized protein HD556DRAFT_1428452 [Suillus plorans]KAG1810405.1 hypothetical protein HD556DRAFT_1428452 [Suillus plorans]
MSISCPKCGKVFSKESSITRHLSQPRSLCHSSIRNMVDISQFAESALQLWRSPNPIPHHGINSDAYPSHFDVDFFETEGEECMSAEERYEGAGTCYSPDGLMFLDLFDVDEYAEYRKDNLFYPFASKEEWEITDFLLHSPLSMAAINEFLVLPMIRGLKLSFSTAQELQSQAEMLPKGPSWKCQVIPSLHRTKNPIRLFWRDPVECLEALFSNPLFHDKLDFVPHRVYTTAARLTHVYSEWLTGDSAWEFQGLQSQVPRGATILGTILSSDKTNITTMTGARVAHPLLLGVLEDRLIHQCLSIILKPLMIAAEIGIMMSDPVGNACMLAGVHGKTSPFTMASYLEFGDNFCHPERTRYITLGYFDACAIYRLNGVHAPFWQDWPFACPSVFLTPEALHHWHKQFFDHDLQWCIAPVTGYHHYSGIIMKLKQVTGRVHRDLQCYIVGLIVGAAPHVTMTLGAQTGTKKTIDNWYIPKLELMQSITASTHKVGALIQWSVDATEHAHVSEIKEPARQTNNNDYDPQICCHLDQQDKLRQFAIAMTLKSGVLDPDPKELPVDEGDDEDIAEFEEPSTDQRTALLEGLNRTRVTTNYFIKAKEAATVPHGPSPHPPRMFTTDNTTIHLNYSPTCTGMKIDDVADEFNIPDLRDAISNFLRLDARNRDVIHGVGVSRRLLIDRPSTLPFDRVQVWHTVRLQEVSFHDPCVILPAQTLHASPPCPGWPKGQQDTVLINVNREYEWPQSGLRGHTICEVQLIILHPATGMHVLKRAKHADGTPVGNIVPLKQLRAFISIIPELGAAADARLTKETSAHYSSSFFLNKYFNKQLYHALYHAS